MKTKLTLSIDGELMSEINQKAKLDRSINLSKMVERFLYNEFKPGEAKTKSTVKSLRGVLKETEATKNPREEKIKRLSKKHLK